MGSKVPNYEHCLMVCQLYEYHYIKELKNWTEAQCYFREKHPDLATVSNMTNMKRLLSISAGYKRDAWIGLFYQTDVNRMWYWSLPGVEINESEINWSKGEPNDVHIENCGFLNEDLTLGDVSCKGEDTSYFVCFDDSIQTKKFHLISLKKTWLGAQNYCREEQI
ncbi:hypothetical protein ATANTOWER_014549 [Ataeniobius toweri]|uniref:C-type lectin domain-containing protein n=1 Tax=Ataeniobius toweri TaxID=208326 RepID=A0ABU7CHH0_9TELE|nr:hypothetical protein [Ataeniobius toweri]